MHPRLKERLVGAAVLVVIAVIFIPMLLTGPVEPGSITETNIPERPNEQFKSKLVPISESLQPLATEGLSDAMSTELNTVDETVENQDVVDEATDTKTATEPNVVAKAEPPSSAKPVKEKQVGLSAWVVQLGSFSSKVNADKLNLKLRKAGFPAFVEPLTKNKEITYRVRVGPELLRSDADTLLKNIKTKMKLDGIVLSYP